MLEINSKTRLKQLEASSRDVGNNIITTVHAKPMEELLDTLVDLAKDVQDTQDN